MPILTEEERLGTLVAGRYRLESILGRGGSGVVFEALHTWTGRQVAVKLLRPEYARDMSLVRRLLQEARAAAGIEHPNVVQVLDMGADQDGTVYLVLELLRGESLSDVLEREPKLAPGRTLAITLPLLDALAHAHRQGIIHRDLKPDNIFLRRDAGGRRIPTLLDFGMARMLETAWGHATQSGALVGTPFYMSPEQAEGERELGPATDVWSMGVILYRCLTGRLPFEATTPTKLLLAIVNARPEAVTSLAPEVPRVLAEAVDRAIVADLDVRYPDVPSLASALRDAAEQSELPLHLDGSSASPLPSADPEAQASREVRASPDGPRASTAASEAEAEAPPRGAEGAREPGRRRIWLYAGASALLVAVSVGIGFRDGEADASSEGSTSAQRSGSQQRDDRSGHAQADGGEPGVAKVVRASAAEPGRRAPPDGAQGAAQRRIEAEHGGRSGGRGRATTDADGAATGPPARSQDASDATRPPPQGAPRRRSGRAGQRDAESAAASPAEEASDPSGAGTAPQGGGDADGNERERDGGTPRSGQSTIPDIAHEW